MSGAMFTDFTVTQPDGQDVSLSDYVGKGKYVLVDFWASWCGPCRRAMPLIKALYEEYNPKGLDVLGVLVWDEVEDSKKAIEEEKAPWPQILNTQRVATDLYAINGIPHLIFFAPDGTILKRGLPDDELINFVKETIDNNK
jgi:thiol-disulfide isomerase/thioredoxin